MIALATNTNDSPKQNVMSISTNARIDYILKFSRHTVIVLDDQQQGFGSVTGTFLSGLSEQTNAALIAVSSKLNDIQVRARVNEQLFPNEAFDPEISLTQSVIEHYIDDSAPIAIVVEQAHHLSLQITHELTLLSELARKSARDISVVLLGDIALGKTVADNYTLFHKKLSMISVANGQLISAHSSLFKSQSPFLAFTPFNKMLLLLLAILAVTFTAIYIMYKADNFQFSQLMPEKVGFKQAPQPSTNNGSFDANTQQIVNEDKKFVALKANANDIFVALNSSEPQIIVAEYASASDILSAINNTEINSGIKNTADIELNSVSVSGDKELSSIEQNDNELQAEQQDFYLTDTGFVIQYTALAYNQEDSVKTVVDNFVRRFLLEDYQFYLRLINDEPFVVITSETFIDKSAAVQAMSALDTELQQSGIWIKSLKTIHTEIAAANSIL